MPDPSSSNRSPVRSEGFWRSAGEPALPMPTVDVEWPDRAAFLAALETVEDTADQRHFKGSSKCRICGRSNGASEHDLGGWRWPEGFRHYLEDHGVRPTPGFEAFVVARSRRSTKGRR